MTIIAPKWKALNRVFNGVADEQGIEPGSLQWISGGLHQFSGETGGHPAYGWMHKHLLSDGWVPAVIANYAHRNAFYEGAPVRQGGYYVGCRPPLWKPETAGDIGDGEYKGEHVYLTSTGFVGVSGPDSEHFTLSPLRAVADSEGFTVLVHEHDTDAALVAREILRYLVSANVGMLRQNGLAGFYSYRAFTNVVTNVVDAGKRGILSTADAQTLHDWVTKMVLPAVEAPPGLNGDDKGNYWGPTQSFLQLYNGWHWALPALHDLIQVTPDTDTIYARLIALRARWSQYIADIHKFAPGEGCMVVGVGIDNAFAVGDAGAPLPTLEGHIEVVAKDQAFRAWGVRAGLIAAHVLDDGLMRASVIGQSKFCKPTDKAWLVDWDGATYL